MKVVNNRDEIKEINLCRITYVKDSKKSYLLKSLYRFVGNRGGFYEVELNLKTMTYKIRNTKQKTIVRSTKKDGRNPPVQVSVLKQQAKRALVSMEVKFDLEVRL